MKVSVIPPRDLGSEQIARWRDLACSLRDLSSPYFSPHFTLAVAAERPGVFVGVAEGSDGGVGFLPFQRTGLGFGSPVGSPLSDYHGLIGRVSPEWDGLDLIRQCGLRAWDFDHLPTEQKMFAPYFAGLRKSPILELSSGFAMYETRLRARGSRHLSALKRKQRKLDREVGPVRFELHDASPELVDKVIGLKSRQCRETGTFDFFQLKWAAGLAHRIAETDLPEFGGVMSALYAGETAVALHLGVRSRLTLHWWFPVYSREHARYSPGQILLMRLAEACCGLGIQTLDLGAGDDPYKMSFQTDSNEVAYGSVVPSTVVAGYRMATRRVEEALRNSLLRGVARRVSGRGGPRAGS